MPTWPSWWEWELELTPHVEKRMEDRGFTEVALRRMMERAHAIKPDIVEGRHVVQTRHSGAAWEVIVEPDDVAELLVVVTAYRVESES